MTEPLIGAGGNDDETMSEMSAHTLYSFKDRDTVFEMIASLSSICQDNLQCERTLEHLTVIIDHYQEQPHLLDPHLEALFTTILDPIIENEHCSPEFVHLSFTFLHPLIKVRGYKRATRYLPHDVCNLERVLTLLESQDKNDASTWATRYCLLLWLSVVAIVPFDLERFARSEGAASGKFLLRLIEVGKTYLLASDICQEAAAAYLSKLFDRFDAKRDGLSSFIDWACERMQSQSDPESDFPARVLYGVLRILGLLFTHGARGDLLQYTPKVFNLIMSLRFLQSSDILIRKLYCKLLQRLCLAFMKKTVQTWRYERGRRVLTTTTSGGDSHSDANSDTLKSKSEQVEVDALDPKTLPFLERTIAQLIAGLGDKDGVVRWSAAKGLARICARLPLEMAEQVIKNVLGLFSVRLSAGGWHGAALVLAEFARRGLLRQSMLVNVVPLVSRALFYDEMQGGFALGAHVRDAACYVCWAFARAYRPADLAPFVRQLGTDLVIVMLFDREIQVRRAAAAAFQENVGRQGTFRLGIDILSICDYFSVGNIRTCYLDLAPAVACLGGSYEYLEPFFNHVIAVKIGHWDDEVRELSSKSLAKLLHIARKQEENCSLIESLLHEINMTNDQNRVHGVLSALIAANLF